MTNEFLVGVDLGATNCRAALFSATGEMGIRREIPSVGQYAVEEGVDRLCRLLGSLLDEAAEKDLLGIGIGSAGPIDSGREMILEAPNMPAWQRVPILAHLRERFSVPVFLENDANLAVFGEYRRGAGMETESLLGLTLGTGIGGGFVESGKIRTGHNGMAAEVGHMYVGGEGIRCGCGAIDCLELYVSGQGIKSWYSRRTGEPNPSCHEIFDRARRGKAAAAAVVRDAATLLGRAIATLQKVVDPERIVVSGGLSREWDIFVGPAREEAKRNLFGSVSEGFDLRPATLGTDAGLYGAAELVRCHLAGV